MANQTNPQRKRGPHECITNPAQRFAIQGVAPNNMISEALALVDAAG
jgi:hypothetical protein